MKNKPLPYYPYYTRDFTESEAVLSMNLAEVGLYQLCLNYAWEHGSIPSDLSELARVIRQDYKAVRVAWPKVASRWIANGSPERLVNPRQEHERAKAVSKSAARSKAAHERYNSTANAGANAGAFAYSNADANDDANAHIRASDVCSIESKNLKQKKDNLDFSAAVERGFDLFWSHAWRTTAKKTAHASYSKKAVSVEAIAAIQAGIERDRPIYLARELDKRPYMATWLNQERYNDEPETNPLPVNPPTKKSKTQELFDSL